MTAPSAPLERARSWHWQTAASLCGSLAALAFPKLGLFAFVGAFIAWASLPRRRGNSLRTDYVLLGASALIATVAFIRFLALEAMPGIVQGGTRATEQRAVSRLRELLFAEDMARKSGSIDPDRDGVGSAGLLGELTGELPARGEARLNPPLLEGYPPLTETSLGPAARIGGFYLAVCIPTREGALSAMPGSRFDDEAAERRFIAYAWPDGEAVGLSYAFALDEHENILMAPAVKDTLRFGAAAPPRCDDVTRETSRGDWKPWMGKKPRTSLPGDRG